jgi:hypothetical protein
MDVAKTVVLQGARAMGEIQELRMTSTDTLVAELVGLYRTLRLIRRDWSSYSSRKRDRLLGGARAWFRSNDIPVWTDKAMISYSGLVDSDEGVMCGQECLRGMALDIARTCGPKYNLEKKTSVISLLDGSGVPTAYRTENFIEYLLQDTKGLDEVNTTEVVEAKLEAAGADPKHLYTVASRIAQGGARALRLQKVRAASLNDDFSGRVNLEVRGLFGRESTPLYSIDNQATERVSDQVMEIVQEFCAVNAVRKNKRVELVITNSTIQALSSELDASN